MKAAAYAQYSTYNQTDNSIAYQMAKIYEYCARNDITVSPSHSYADEALSGTNTEDRVEFLKMLGAASNKEFEAVIIYDITRGSRDVGDWFNFRKTMSKLNIKVIAVEDKLGDILNPNDFLVELINVGIGQHAVLTTRQKSMDGVAVKAKDGVFLGGYAPLGYDVVNQEYVINESEAATIRIIFNMYAAGESYRAILERIKGAKGKRGKPLGGNSLNSILKNERYIGIYSWNKRHIKKMREWAGGGLNPNGVRIENKIPAIIDLETWERVQRRMNENTKKATNKAKREYLLTGLIECGCCGATYVGHTSTNKKGYEYKAYICGNKYRTRTCKAKNGNANILEEFVIMNLLEYFGTMDFEAEAQKIADMVNAASADLTNEKKELAELTRKIANGLKVLVDMPDFEEMKEEVDAMRVRKNELADIIARNSVNNQKLDKNKLVEFFKESAASMDDNHIKTTVKEHVTNIIAHADGSFTVNVGVNLGVVHTTYCGGRI